MDANQNDMFIPKYHIFVSTQFDCENDRDIFSFFIYSVLIFPCPGQLAISLSIDENWKIFRTLRVWDFQLKSDDVFSYENLYNRNIEDVFLRD